MLSCFHIVLLIFSGCAALGIRLAPSSVNPRARVPVFSLATFNADGSTNMNVITFATAISIKPEPLWAISLYKNTLSHENFFNFGGGWGMLQTLDITHIDAIDLLGKSSGRDVDKIRKMKDEGKIALQVLPLDALTHDPSSPANRSSTRSITLLSSSRAILSIQRVPSYDILDAGDHDVIICRVLETFSLESSDDEVSSVVHDVLDTQMLRQHGIIS